MDLDGLEKLMKEQHCSVIGKLDSLERAYKEQVKICSVRMLGLETDVKEHDRLINKSRGAIKVFGAIWAAITFLAALVAPYFWR